MRLIAQIKDRLTKHLNSYVLIVFIERYYLYALYKCFHQVGLVCFSKDIEFYQGTDMQPSHQNASHKYAVFKQQARQIARTALPIHLNSIFLEGIDHKALTAFRLWQEEPSRKVDWDWNFASRYCFRHPKAFDLSVWNKNMLLSLTLGRPTYRGASIRMDFMERNPGNDTFAGELFGVSQLAYETYGRLIGAESIRLIEPMNDKLVSYYTSKDNGFRLFPAKQGNPHYLEKSL